METESDQCYCGNLDREYIAGTFQCRLCRKRFHPGCLHSAISSPLSGDTFYNFLCSKCGENNEEEYERSNISWQNVVMLALYNLQLGAGGKKGYFRWKEHICAFIDKHWDVLFGKNRKKTSLWHGTVAGTLSSGSPQYFLSGTLELGEHGWWKLAEMMPPTFTVEPASKGGPKRSKPKKPGVATTTAAVAGIITGESEPKRPRRSHSFSLNAAMELKAKRTDIKESKRNRRGQAGEATLTQTISQSAEDSFTFSLDAPPASTSSVKTAGHPTTLSSEPQTKQPFPRRPVISLLRGPADEESLDFAPSESSNISTSFQSSRSSSQADLSQDEDSQDSSGFFTQETWGSVQQHKLDVLPPLMMDNEDDDIDIDPASMSPLGLDALQALENSSVIEEFITRMTESASIEVQEQIKVEECSVMKASDDRSETEYEKERSDEEPEEESSDRESSSLATDGKVPAHSKRQFRMSKKEATGEAEDKNERENLRLMSLYEEVALLKKLNRLVAVAKPAEGKEMLLNSEEEQLQLSRRMLRRKLIVRKLKREHGLPVFDLDVAVGQWVHKHVGSSHPQQESELNSYASTIVHHPYGYARFLKSYKEFDIPDQYTSFYTRLMGFEDDQRLPITSPYTMRVLKPFIYRDSAVSPQRVQLLQEIVAYPHRNDHSWQPPPTATIDYCYIRPQHIPSVNSMCRTFFWPGLDLSECLQYPDFSCVVMYKKLVVGFAFMVPDVKFNEAYISFIFTHPEWRNAGIAHFMLYHLIRTCMGKDVTLHVSVTNPAVLLYQKFGFKAEELCLDFYDKYFPVDSKECKHAFFMRLRR